MSRKLVDDEGVSVMVAKCTMCNTEYEFYGPKSVPIIIGGPRLLALLLVTLLLSIIGGIIGVLLATQGGVELNPILAFYMGHGPVYYFFMKYFLTAFGLLLLVLSRKRFETLRKFDTEQILLGAQVVFALTLMYHLLAFGSSGKILLLAMGMWVGSVYYLKPSGLAPIMNLLSSAPIRLYRRIRVS